MGPPPPAGEEKIGKDLSDTLKAVVSFSNLISIS